MPVVLRTITSTDSEVTLYPNSTMTLTDEQARRRRRQRCYAETGCVVAFLCLILYVCWPLQEVKVEQKLIHNKRTQVFTSHHTTNTWWKLANLTAGNTSDCYVCTLLSVSVDYNPSMMPFPAPVSETLAVILAHSFAVLL